MCSLSRLRGFKPFNISQALLSSYPRNSGSGVGFRSLSNGRKPTVRSPQGHLSGYFSVPSTRRLNSSVTNNEVNDALRQESTASEMSQPPSEGGQSINEMDAAQADLKRGLDEIASDNSISLQMGGKRPLTKFGSFWLRDHCQCSECIHPETRQRQVDTFKISSHVKAQDVSYDDTSAQIQWSDGHRGIYPFIFLRSHSPDTETVRYQWPKMKYRRAPTHNPLDPSYPTVDYSEVMSNNQGLLAWLENIYEWGFCFVRGVPVDPESTENLLKRIAFIRNTHYGGFWDFTADLTFKDTAYTNEFLGPHTDNTYFTDPARLQLFHLLSHEDGDGGASLLVDGFKAAEVLHTENYSHAGHLASIPQPAHSSGNEDVCLQPSQQFPVLNYHPELRRLYQVRWNNYDRAAKRDWTVKAQKAWYEAARHWNHVINRRNMQIWTQLEPGTALIFDNWRMLHGRSQFVGKRRMCGGYINNDDFISRYRLLKFGRERVLGNLGNNANTVPNPNAYL